MAWLGFLSSRALSAQTIETLSPTADRIISIDDNQNRVVYFIKGCVLTYHHSSANDFANRYIIVYNGEIYNFLELLKNYTKSHVFRTRRTLSDPTFFLEWGEDCLANTNGILLLRYGIPNPRVY